MTRKQLVAASVLFSALGPGPWALVGAALQAPATEVYLASLTLAGARASAGVPVNISKNAGYDNQPSFLPDGSAILFSSNRDGKQTDIYFLELPTRQLRQFTRTPESEYSPTVMPDEAGVSVIRVEADGTQRVWQFAEGGTGATVLAPAVKPAGYHAWIDAGHLAVFVLGKPATLQIVDVASGKAETVASDIGRALLRRPTGTISFVHRENGAWIVKEYDFAAKAIRPLVPALEGSAERDAAWGPDGSLFMTRGTEVHAWRPGQDGFRLVGDPGIGQLSRLAVSADGRWMALVAAEAQN